MFGSAILEAALGVGLVYLLLSLICSALQEALEAKLKIRASNLEQGVRELLHDPDGTRLTAEIYNHPLVFGLFRGRYESGKVRSGFSTNLPSYIPAGNFAAALIDLVVRGPVAEKGDATAAATEQVTFQALRSAIPQCALLGPSLQRILLLALDSAQGDLAKAQANVEAWFNSAMDRVSGWYKRRVQMILVGVGLAVSVGLNVDSLKVVRELYHNDALRAAVVAEAGAAGKGDTAPTASFDAVGALEKLTLPMGWPDEEVQELPAWYWKVVGSLYHHLLGWVITAFAISFGAPFWFDVLNRLMVVRSTVKPHEKSPEESSEDRQAGETPAAKWQL